MPSDVKSDRPLPGRIEPMARPTGLAAPLYEQLKHRLSELILVGDWPPGTVLPSEVELARQYAVAVGTVRRALSDLTAEGLLMRRRKTGTVVTDRPPHYTLRFLFQYFRLHGANGELLESEATVFDYGQGPAKPAERARLKLDEGERVIRFRRVRRVDGRPALHERIVLPARRFPDFPPADDLPNRIYVFFLERYDIRLSSARESLSAELPNAEDRRLLELPEGQAILVIDQISYDQGGQPVEWRVRRALTDRYRYVNEVR